MRFQVITWVILSIFCLCVQSSYSAPIDASTPYNASRTDTNPYSEESIVNLTIPFDEDFKKFIIDQLTAPGTQIKEISKLSIDPINRLFILEGTAELPAYVMSDMDNITGHENSLPMEHRFNISFKLPSTKKLALTRYFQIEIVEFKLGGHSYLKAFNRISQFATGLLLNTSFMNYMLDVKPEMRTSEDNVALQIKEMIEKKGLRFRGNTIAFKLDISKIPSLTTYAKWLEDFRLWQFSPVLFLGTNDLVALKVQGGSGKPSKKWLANVAKRDEGDQSSLKDAREEFYNKYSDISVFMQEMDEFSSAMKVQLMLEELDIRDINQLSKLRRTTETRARKSLNKKNALFLASPLDTYENTNRDAREYIISTMTSIKRKVLLNRKIKNGGSNSLGVPFLEKRISQDTFSQAVRFFRDFEFENEQMFKELHIFYDPTIPGISIRGMMNINYNTFMAMGLEGSGIEWNKTPWRPAEDTWGSAMPFSTTLRIKMLDDGWLGLDVNSFSIFTGSERTPIDTNSEHGGSAIRFIKMALVNTMAATLIEDPLATTTTPTEGELNASEQRIRSNMLTQGQDFNNVTRVDDDLTSLVNLAKIDIEKNPFILAGKEHIQGKMEHFFKELIKYDDESGLILFKVDPKIVAETIMDSENTVQVWNIESLYDEKLNQTYLEFTAGNNKRSKKYLKTIHSRDEFTASQNFVGIDEARKTAPADMRMKVNLKSFESLINKVLADAYHKQKLQVDKAMGRDEESEHYLIKDMGLKVVENGILKLNLSMTYLKKAKRSFINPARYFSEKYKTTQKTINLSTEIALSVEKLEKYISKISLAKNEVFLGNELLRLDLRKASFTTRGDTTTLDKITNIVAGDVDFKRGMIAKKVKYVVLKFMKHFLHSTKENKNGNIVLGGFRLNQFIKLLTHKEEILIQINPRFATAAFDIRLLPNQTFNGESLGFTLNKKAKTLGIDFSTNGAMASVDKGELLRIMVEANQMIAPYLKIQNKEELIQKLRTSTLFDRFFYNSDYKKMSLVHRLNRVLTNYTGLQDIVKMDSSVIDAINNSLSTNFSLPPQAPTSDLPSLSGVELMYVASVALVIKENINKLISHMEDMSLTNVQGLEQFEERLKLLEESFIAPLYNHYKLHFRAHNRKIVNKGPTDWNFSYFPDANYSESVFKQLQKLQKK
ncbi:hypothetical protein A9Q84_01070 [Halobacteriovorax marinus]|uniref:Secreted protein n=1 Tax=Halobacteriovorax marinus TaxID=97084 RepID=A0A1Y5FBY8_9BACT|nr:hypothetical protein A9Q84_01070 [Halobacteriovorax marinus]